MPPHMRVKVREPRTRKNELEKPKRVERKELRKVSRTRPRMVILW